MEYYLNLFIENAGGLGLAVALAGSLLLSLTIGLRSFIATVQPEQDDSFLGRWFSGDEEYPVAQDAHLSSVDTFLDSSTSTIGTTGFYDFAAIPAFAVNPANGLPMMGGIGGIDVAGNPYGTDFSHDQITSFSIDDSWSSSSSSSFDSWSSGSGSSFSDW
jgi:hypothetical protein